MRLSEWLTRQIASLKTGWSRLREVIIEEESKLRREELFREIGEKQPQEKDFEVSYPAPWIASCVASYTATHGVVRHSKEPATVNPRTDLLRSKPVQRST